MLRGILTKQIHQSLGLDIVVLYQSLDRIFVLLATDVLMGGEIGDNVKALFLPENPRKNGIVEIQGVSTIILRYIQSGRGTDIARQLNQPVFIQVDDNQFARLESQNGLDERRTDATGSADDTDRLVLYFFPELNTTRLDISLK